MHRRLVWLLLVATEHSRNLMLQAAMRGH